MAAKRLRAAPTRLARALFWLGRSPIALTLEKRILEALATPGWPGVCAVNPGTVQRISRPFDVRSVVAVVPQPSQDGQQS
jgi:hypothetical protein